MGWLGKVLGGGIGFLVGGPAGAAAGASIGGGIDASKSAKKASKQQVASQQAAIDEQRRQYDTTRADLAPWRTVGEGALGKIASLYGISPDGTTPAGAPDYSAFTSSPDYQFNLQEGLKAVQGSAAARGGLYSGRAGMALQERGAGIASNQLNNYTARLASLAGIGQSATNTVANAGSATAGNVGQLLTQQGDARASGVAGSNNALSSALGQAGGYLYDWYTNRNKAGNMAYNWSGPGTTRAV